ncbi:solute carrier organic anion transporter family, member 3A [Mytilus galloprovincialis]|uniref:Solute carrier organic anion transporter family member n=2 Tax=Mytilus galloprovincialis TaxID=29158 RepID=A0A8B6FKK5_MYTGA|nr:solute carrier organic anion transporter family, member 3A [Mytilus galloprovincialis]
MIEYKQEMNTQSDKCGIGRCQPKSLQYCATIACFTGIYSLSSLTTSTLSIYISSQITTLEKQFGFNSSQSGFLLSCNDIGFLLLTLFVSYRATTAHIPLALGISTVLYGFAGILCSFAYFLMPSQGSRTETTNRTSFEQTDSLQLCNLMNLSSYDADQCESEAPKAVGTATTFTPFAMVIIAIGMILQGIGKSPRTPYVSYYVDENVEKRKTSMYLGIIITVGIFGPALAFALGAVFSNIYVTLEDVTITTRDPRWIGAWWLGFLIFGIISIVISLPLFCFPKHFQSNKEVIKTEPKENVKFLSHMKGFISTVLRLFRNGCFTFSILGSCLQMFFVSGMISFMPKFLETQFTIPTWHANLLMGGLNICSASLGTFIGGFIVYKFRMTPYACMKLALILTATTSFAPLIGFFVGCDNPEIIGYNTKSNVNLTTCIEDCNCNKDTYFPVCGSDNRNYFSYCQAGCMEHNLDGYAECKCIGEGATATPGLCKPDCDMLYVYISLVFVFALSQTIALMPEYIFVMRCVDDKDKAMALAFRSLLATVLGWFPGPVIVGKVVDTCCRLWNSSCGGTGACALYDLVDFRYRRHALDLGVKLVATVFSFLAFMCARNRQDLKQKPVSKLEKTIIPEVEELMEKSTDDEHIHGHRKLINGHSA